MAKNSNNNSAVSTQQPLLKTGKPTWSGFRWKFKLLAPYLWPRGKLHLQVCIILAFLLQVLVRIVALFTPILFKKIVDNLSQYQRSDNSVEVTATFTPRNETLENQEDQAFQWHWHYILIFVALKALIGSGGYLTAIRNSLWQLSLQYQKACLHIRLFQHILSLSMRWHISRKTGQVIQVMDRGVTGCTTITNVVVSQIGPIIADVIIAIVFFLSAFDVYIGLIVIFTLVIYALVTVLLSEWRTKYRRARNDAENQKASTAVDSILNVETVKLFTGETWEVDRFTEDAQKFQKAEWRMHFTTNMYATARVSVLNSGFLAGCLLSAHYVVTGHFTTGDFVLFASYLTQLFEPLNMLGANYRMLQQGFIDMEHMFDILETEPEIREDPSTTPLTISEGNIQFENVSFSFNEGQQIMEDVSFTVNPGEIQALVGKSGVGKTTISRLLMRLYDIEAGKILIDGQDISKVKINSLREQIGVVPQDSALFNDSVKYNIMYGRPTSTMTDIISVAHTTKIHETISQFPQGYDTVIGEKGLKLSGGERQRIAIARMLLKNPKLVILDEATSALDTGTERNIQSALLPSFQGRTTIIIAHRLSTVVHADNIIVFDKGKIIESGTHNDLLRRRGTYAQMWAWQQEEANKINEPMLLQSLGIPQDATSPTSTIHSMYTSDGEDYSIADLEEHLNIDDPFIQTEQENQLERQRENFTANDPNLTALHDAHQASGEANETDQQRSVNNEVPKDEKDSDDDNLNTSQTCDGISKDALKNDTENGVNNLT